MILFAPILRYSAANFVAVDVHEAGMLFWTKSGCISQRALHAPAQDRKIENTMYNGREILKQCFPPGME